MELSSRTPEGDPHRCIVCGNSARIDPSRPSGDAPCPSCGALLWFDQLTDEVVGQLADRGAFVTADDDGQVRSIRFSGAVYDDTAIAQLARMTGLQTIDIRDTKITPAGAARLRRVLPSVKVLH